MVGNDGGGEGRLAWKKLDREKDRINKREMGRETEISHLGN